MTKPKRFASVLALLVAFVMLFFVLFFVLEADHDCCGEDCAVCARILFCEDLLRNILISIALVSAALCFSAPLRVFADSDCCLIYPDTLIALKVKLSD